MPDQLEILAVHGMGDIVPGTDLAGAIVAAAPWLRDGDILVVTSKIVSKSEGRLVEIATAGAEREAAREEILQAETARPVARRGNTRIVATHHGFVMASAGIDASNVDRSRLVLLPKDPDASARALRAALRERFGLTVAVVVSDTMGRPWRNGLTDVALGAAGIAPIRDHRGEIDPYGNELQITQMAVIDELSGAAELVKGKCDRVPVAVIRGYPTDDAGPDRPGPDGPGAVVLVRAAEHDLFTLGTAEARAAGLRGAAGLADVARFADPLAHPGAGVRAIDAAALVRIVRSVPTATGTVLTLADPAALAGQDGRAAVDLPANTTHVLVCAVAGELGDARLCLRLGEDVHRVRCALAAVGLASTWLLAPVSRAGPNAVGWGANVAGLLAIGPTPH